MSWKEKVVDKFFDKAEERKEHSQRRMLSEDPYYEKRNKSLEPPRVINRYEYTLEDEKYFSNPDLSSYNKNNHQVNYRNSIPKTRIYSPDDYYEPLAESAYNPRGYNRMPTKTLSSPYQRQPIFEDTSSNHFDNGDYQAINQNVNRYDEAELIDPNISYRPLSLKLIPKEIANEVRSEKYRLIFTMIIGFFGVITTAIILILWILKEGNIVTDNESLIPHPALMTPLCILSLGLFFVALFDWMRISREVENFLKNAKVGNHVIPNFIINNYKKMHVRSIIINWIAFPCYILGALAIVILYFLSKTIKPKLFGFIILDVSIRDLTTEIIILTSLLFAIFFLQVLNIVFVRKRKANIIGYYGYEIVNPYEMSDLKKKINRRCLLTMLTILGIIFFIIAIPLLIIRRRKVKVTT